MKKIIEFGTKLFDIVGSMPNELSIGLTEKAGLVPVEDISDAERNIYNGVQNLAPETVVSCFPTFTKDKREELVEFAKQLTVVLTPKQYLNLCEAVNGVYVEESRVLFETALEQDPKLEFNKEYAEFGNEMFEMQLGMNAWERFMDNLPQDCRNKNVLLAEPKWYNYLPEFKDIDEMWDFATELVSEMNSVEYDLEEYDDYNPKTASKIVERTQKILNERNEELGRMVDIQRFIPEAVLMTDFDKFSWNVYGKYGENSFYKLPADQWKEFLPSFDSKEAMEKFAKDFSESFGLLAYGINAKSCSAIEKYEMWNTETSKMLSTVYDHNIDLGQMVENTLDKIQQRPKQCYRWEVAEDIIEEFGYENLIGEEALSSLHERKDIFMNDETSYKVFEMAKEEDYDRVLEVLVSEAYTCPEKYIRDWGRHLYDCVERDDYINICREIAEDNEELALGVLAEDVVNNPNEYEGVDPHEFLSMDNEREM